ncbi:MAG: ATP-binding protein, partial [bacterium]
MNASILRGRDRMTEKWLLCALAALCAAVYLACFAQSLRWIGKTFPGFLLMDNRVVPAAGLPYWEGLRAGPLFLRELVSVDGRPATSAHAFSQRISAAQPGQVLTYTFRNATELFSLSIPAARFSAKDFSLLFGFYFLNGLAFLLSGFVVRAVRPNQQASLAMLAVGLSAGLWATTACDLYGPYRFWRLHAFFECFMPGAIFHLCLVFPETAETIRRRPALITVPYWAALVLAFFYQLFLYHPDRYVTAHNLATLYFGLALVFFLFRVTRSYLKTESLLTKQRTKVLFLGSFVALLLPAVILLAAAFAEQDVSITQIGFLTILWPVALGYAILKHDLFEIDALIKRSIYYISVTATILSLYLAVLLVFDRSLRGHEISRSPYFPLFFCLFILLVFNPLRARVQSFVDRVFFRIRYDYRATVEEVSRALTSLLNIDEIVRSLLSTLTETMTIHKGLIALRLGEDRPTWSLYPGERSCSPPAAPQALFENEPALIGALETYRRPFTRYDLEEGIVLPSHRDRLLAFMTDTDLLMVLPILFRSRLIGLMGIGRRKSGQAYSRADLELLETLANQSAVALANATSYRELQDLNQNLEALVRQRTQELEASKTELESSYEKLKELDQLKSQFFSNVGHELRTPLTLSLAPLESMLQGEMGRLDPTQSGILRTIHRNALKLLRLVNNLLDFSKIEAGRLTLNIGSYALVPFLNQLVEPFRLAAMKKNISFSFPDAEGDRSGLLLYFDPDRMEKVFANLFSNALKFTPPGGKIELAVYETEETVEVSVADTGAGIPPADLPRIFERFYQAASKGARRVPGTGIGLSLVKEFTELHGGSVAVRSLLGRGTVFTVRLRKGREHLPDESIHETPAERSGLLSDTGARVELCDLDSPDELPSLPPDAAAPAGLPADAPGLLIVEDNPEMRRFLRMLLERHYRVREAGDGQEGLDLALAEHPDLILSDVNMPRMNGFELCRSLKQHPDLRSVPFILLTSQTEVQHRIEGFEAGADEYVGKPFNTRELMARVRSLLDLRRAHRDLRAAHEDLKQAHEELQQTEAQLVHSEKMASLGQLVAGVAHELNNPISFIYGNMRVLEDYLESIRKVLDAYRSCSRESGAARELEAFWRESDMDFVLSDLASLIEGCREGATRTKQIVQDLRTFSRLDEAERQTADLNEGIRSTLNLLGSRLKGRIRVHLDLGDLPPVECYAGQINQVFMNLLANAEQAISGSGDIWIRSRCLPSGEVECRIRDSGPGIPADILHKIFDPFFTTKPVGSGTGLGLSISYGIARRHGGRITAESEPGQGAVFTLLIPVAPFKAREGAVDAERPDLIR